MPLTANGEKIRAAMHSQYGEKKGESVFYASINAGKIKGAEKPGQRPNPSTGTPAHFDGHPMHSASHHGGGRWS
jgi:hypothetical protein